MKNGKPERDFRWGFPQTPVATRLGGFHHRCQLVATCPAATTSQACTFVFHGGRWTPYGPPMDPLIARTPWRSVVIFEFEGEEEAPWTPVDPLASRTPWRSVVAVFECEGEEEVPRTPPPPPPPRGSSGPRSWKRVGCLIYGFYGPRTPIKQSTRVIVASEGCGQGRRGKRPETEIELLFAVVGRFPFFGHKNPSYLTDCSFFAEKDSIEKSLPTRQP